MEEHIHGMQQETPVEQKPKRSRARKTQADVANDPDDVFAHAAQAIAQAEFKPGQHAEQAQAEPRSSPAGSGRPQQTRSASRTSEPGRTASSCSRARARARG